MKRKALIFIAALFAFLCLSACDNGKEEQTDSMPDTQTEQTQGSVQTEQVKPVLKKVTLQLTNNKKPLYQVVYSLNLGTDSKTAVTDFILRMYEKTGVQLPVVQDSTSKPTDKKEIIVCDTARSESKDMTKITYADYGIEALDDGTILVWGYGVSNIDKAFDSLLMGTFKMQDGEHYYKGLALIESRQSEVLAALPNATFGKIDGVYQSADEVFQVTVANARAADINTYKDILQKAGYKLHAENSIGAGNTFSTYKNDKYAIHTAYHGATSEMELIIEKLGYLPDSQAPMYTKKVDASITQLKIVDGGGMCYVIQLEDGSFVVIDGGVSNSSVQQELLTLLQSKNEGMGYEKPRVTWMFTHAHPDHIQLASNFLSTNASKIELTMVCANFIDLSRDYASTIGDGYSHAELMNTVRNKYPNAKIMNFHTGQKLRLAGCDITFYITHEDVYPVKMGTLNSSSAAWKMDFGSKTFMVLGDTTETSAEILNSYYGSSLKSTVMQAAHHGITASSGTANIIKLYSNIDPDVVMWANSNASAVAGFAGNTALLSKSGLVSYFSNQTKSYSIK